MYTSIQHRTKSTRQFHTGFRYQIPNTYVLFMYSVLGHFIKNSLLFFPIHIHNLCSALLIFVKPKNTFKKKIKNIGLIKSDLFWFSFHYLTDSSHIIRHWHELSLSLSHTTAKDAEYRISLNNKPELNVFTFNTCKWSHLISNCVKFTNQFTFLEEIIRKNWKKIRM